MVTILLEKAFEQRMLRQTTVRCVTSHRRRGHTRLHRLVVQPRLLILYQHTSLGVCSLRLVFFIIGGAFIKVAIVELRVLLFICRSLLFFTVVNQIGVSNVSARRSKVCCGLYRLLYKNSRSSFLKALLREVAKSVLRSQPKLILIDRLGLIWIELFLFERFFSFLRAIFLPIIIKWQDIFEKLIDFLGHIKSIFLLGWLVECVLEQVGQATFHGSVLDLMLTSRQEAIGGLRATVSLFTLESFLQGLSQGSGRS